MITPLAGKRVLITGANGFLGMHLVEAIEARCPATIITPRKREYDLSNQDAATAMFKKYMPEVVIHLAAAVGGIGANKENPGKLFYENCAMGLHVIEAARLRRVQKTVNIGTVCSYPSHTPVPFKEIDLWNGYPEASNAPNGISKRAVMVWGRLTVNSTGCGLSLFFR